MILLLKSRPTPAQAEAGNYKKPRRKWNGLEIAIENPVGSVREGKGWRTKMKNAYGYICRSEAVDGDEVDVYLGPDMDTAPMVYVVHQRKAGDWDAYDEDKAMCGFMSEAAARTAYLAHYDDKRFLGQITAMPVDEFVRKVRATKEKPAMIKAVLFLKTHIEGYTKKDGTFVAAHEDKRSSAEHPYIQHHAAMEAKYGKDKMFSDMDDDELDLHEKLESEYHAGKKVPADVPDKQDDEDEYVELETQPYHRFTNGGPMNGDIGFAMFAEGKGNTERLHIYGKNHHTFNPKDLPPEAVVDVRDEKFIAALRDALSETGDYSDEEIESLLNESAPEDIVNSAQFWDDLDLVGIALEKVLEPNGWRAVKTPDGAIVFDESAIRSHGGKMKTSLLQNEPMTKAILFLREAAQAS